MWNKARPRAPEKKSKVSFCLIVRNEESCLARCLESLKTVAHEIIIVDTGSTDRTLEIASNYTEKIFHHVWEDDFAAARNAALAYATGDWIGIVDADEELLPETAALLPNYLSQPEFQNRDVVLNWLVRSHQHPDLMTRGLFPNRRGIHFAGRVHEIPVSSQGKLSAYQCQELVLRHHQDVDKTAYKKVYYNALLQQSLLEEQDPALRMHAQKHLGLGLLSQKQYLDAWRVLEECYMGMKALNLPPYDGFYGEVLRGLVEAGIFLGYAQTQRYTQELHQWYPLEPIGRKALGITEEPVYSTVSKARRRTFGVVWASLSLLTACQFIPSTFIEPHSNNQTGFVLASYGGPSAGPSPTPNPNLITFPSLVQPQSFAPVNNPDTNSKFWWIRFVVPKEVPPQAPETEISGSDEDDEPAQSAEESAQDAPPDNAPHKHRIWINENGNFSLTLKAGNKFEVTDNDARDGSATVVLPSELLAGFLQVQGPKSKEEKKNKPAINRKLTVNESLYYVSQSVSRNAPSAGKQSWLKMGKRPFPLPATWNSGASSYVFNFTNEGVQKFVTRWYRTQTGQTPDYPVGIKEIGSSGGVINLPGVAKLEIPVGALSAPTTVKLSQALQGLTREKECHISEQTSTCFPGWVYVSPIVKIEPLNLQLATPARLTQSLLPEADNHPPLSVGPMGSEDPLVNKFYPQDSLTEPPEIVEDEQVSLDMATMISQFMYITKMAPVLPFSSSDQNFHVAQAVTQSTPPPHCPFLNTKGYDPNDITGNLQNMPGHFRINDISRGHCLPSVALTNAETYLEKAYNYYVGLSMNPP